LKTTFKWYPYPHGPLPSCPGEALLEGNDFCREWIYLFWAPLVVNGGPSVKVMAIVMGEQDMQVMGETVRLHLVAALQALQREASLLDSNDLETLNAMLEGVRNAAAGSSFQPRGSGTVMLESRHSAALSDMTPGPMASGVFLSGFMHCRALKGQCA
jgi:hypothetical protein